jgi:hypothetical protein
MRAIRAWVDEAEDRDSGEYGRVVDGDKGADVSRRRRGRLRLSLS